MAADPRDLSALLIERYNARDLDGMLELVAHDVDYVRPGPVVVHGLAGVRARYEEDWAMFDTSRVELTSMVASGDDVAAEIHMTLRRGAATIEAEGAVFHGWRDGLLRRYRAFFDPLPG